MTQVKGGSGIQLLSHVKGGSGIQLLSQVKGGSGIQLLSQIKRRSWEVVEICTIMFISWEIKF
jgi:hypothetical protein